MTSHSPPTRRAFADKWDEIRYLRAKVLHWLYEKRQRAKALGFAARMKSLLRSVDDHAGILGEECWSLIHECEGHWKQAIRSREMEIELLEQFLERSSQTGAVQSFYDWSDLTDRLDLLATLHEANGERAKAVEVLERSKSICKKRHLQFDGEDLLAEYTRPQAKITFARARA